MPMLEPTLNYVHCADPSGGHRMAYGQWGDFGARHVVVCVHGLSRQGRDFDVLARALVAHADHPVRVVCPDVVGRGRSDWLKDPMGYQLPQYVADMLSMLSQLREQAPIGTLDWVGTSMGGLIAMGICGTPHLAPEPGNDRAAALPVAVRRLVLNDVGPAIQWQALERIGIYLGRAGRFDSVQQAADAMWAISTSFGPHTPRQWLALSQHMVRPLPEGGYTLHYDPAIAVPFRSVTRESAAEGEAALWHLYDFIRARTLLTRGAVSDLLARDTALEMTRRGPRARLVEFDGVGHAPTLIADNQVEAVTSFLLGQCNDEKPDSGAP
jgi:pimeloyl-ACP methyl ester carboxylesterase